MFNFRCPVCGGMMAHSRLRGYHCHIESHNEQAREMELDIILKNQVLTDEEIEVGLESPSVQTSEYFEERAMKAMQSAQKKRATKLS